MMNCKYTTKDDGKQYDLLTLTEKYYKSKSVLSNTNIFSKEEIRESVIKTIRAELDKKNIYINMSDKTPAYEFITKLNVDYFKSLGIDRERLAPEYIEVNRIQKFVEDKLEENPFPDTSKVKEEGSESFSMLVKSFPEVDKKVLKYYLDEITEIIQLEERTKVLGTGIHKLLQQVINKNGITSSEYIAEFEKIYENNQDLLKEGKEEWKNKLDTIILSIYNHVSALGTPISEVVLVSENVTQLRGVLDIIVVTDSGDAHIFDLKISKNDYNDWDSAKIVTTDWQLAIYRQLLGQHVKVKSTSLNIIPIKVGITEDNKLNPSNMTFTGIRNRTAENKEFHVGGYLFEIAEKLIPSKPIIDYNPERKTKFLADLNTLFPDFKIKTSTEKNDPDRIKEIAKNKAKEVGKFEWATSLKGAPGVVNGKISVSPLNIDGSPKSFEEQEKEFSDKVDNYITYVNSIENLNVAQLRDALVTAVNDPQRTQIHTTSDKKKIVINNVMKDYLNGEYEVLQDIEEAVALGFIVLRNKVENTYVIISISSYNQKAAYDNKLTYGDIEYIKSLLFLDHFYEELGLDFRKIEKLVVFNLEKTQLEDKPLENAYDNYQKVIESSHLKTKLQKDRHLISPIKQSISAIRSSYRHYSGSDKSTIENIFSTFDEPIDSVTYEKLLDARDRMIKAYPELKDKTIKGAVNFSDEKEYIFALLQTAILFKSGQSPEGDFIGMRDWGIYFSDFKSLVSSLYTHRQDEYDERQTKILGIIGGLKTITPDKVLSKDLQNINQIVSNGNSQIRHLIDAQSSRIRKLTKEYYSQIGYSKTSQNWIGNARERYADLFVTDESGNISNQFKLKNPYSYTLENAMSDDKREYVKNMLFEIQKYMLNLSNAEIEATDLTSMETIEKTSPKIYKAILDGKYFKVPLIRSEQIDRNKKYIKGGITNAWQTGKDRITELRDYFDDRELSPEELKWVNETQVGYYEMYDVYGRQSDAFKVEMINKHGVDYYELNLDTIAHRVAFNKIRKNVLDNRLPIINAYIWWMKLHAGKQNKDLSKELEYIVNQLKLAAYDQPIIDEEYEDIISAVSVVKKFTTIGMLAFRPVLLVKELSIGIFKGVSLAATQLYGKDQFTLESLAKALKVMLTIDNKLTPEWNLIDGINNYYGFANMDVNTISKKVQTNRRGIYQGLSRWMYACNTIPDYYNRLSLFVAKMIHDGSYDAHTLVNGSIKYDPIKDGRFKHYFENRDKYKNEKGEYIPAKNDEKYNYQRNLYNLLISEINKERIGTGRKTFKADDIVDQAYSEKERTSFKSFTDTAYGYYDKDSQAQWHNTAFGTAFLQFMQFWPGKMHMWFGKPVGTKESGIDVSQSPIGKFTQKTTTDKEGNKVKWYRKYDEKTNTFEETTENTGDPVVVWEGTPQEGLVYAIGYTLQDIFRGDFKGAFGDKERLNRVYFAMADTLMMLLIFGLIKALFDAFIAENGTDGIDGRTALFMSEMSKKVLSEANVYENTLGALRTEPAFWSYSTRVANSVQDVFSGSKTIQEVLPKNVRMFEFM